MSNITSTASGDWSAGGTWVGGIAPVIGDKVTIANGHTVTVDATALGGGDDSSTAVNVNGVLKFSRLADSELTVRGNIVVGAAGELDMGKQGDPISGFDATLKLNDSASLAAGKWGLSVTNAGSKVYANGETRKVCTTLTAQASSGQPDITVADVTGWVIGGVVGIVGTTSSKTDSEVKTILSIAGNVVTFTTNLSATHASGAAVAYFSSNVTITSASTSNRGYVNLKHGYGGTASTGSIQLQNIAITYVGGFGNTFMGVEVGQIGTPATASYAQWNNVSIYECQSQGLFIQAMDQLATWRVVGLAIHVSNHYLIQNDNSGNFEIEDFVFIPTGAASYTHYGGNAAPAYARLVDGCYGPSPAGVAHLRTPANGTIWERVRFMSCNVAVQPFDNQIHRSVLRNCWLCHSSVGAPQGDYLYFMGNGKAVDILFEDCLFNTSWTNSFKAQPASIGQRVTFANYQQDPTAQETYTEVGSVFRDNSVGFDSATPSERFEPFSPTTPLAQTFQILAPSGALVTVSGKIKQNFATAGATRVTLSGLGITPSVWTSAADGSNWQTFVVSGTQSSGATGLFTLTVETFNSSYSTSGTNKVWLDAIAAPAAVALNTGDLGVWFDGEPAALVTANYVTPADVVTVMDASSTRLALAEKFNRNKLIADAVGGTFTLYDDDDVTPLLSGALWKDAAGLIPYAGDGADRRDRLT